MELLNQPFVGNLVLNQIFINQPHVGISFEIKLRSHENKTSEITMRSRRDKYEKKNIKWENNWDSHQNKIICLCEIVVGSQKISQNQ